VSDYCLTPSKQFFMASTSYISMWWWWCPLCTRSTCILIWNFI